MMILISEVFFVHLILFNVKLVFCANPFDYFAVIVYGFTTSCSVNSFIRKIVSIELFVVIFIFVISLINFRFYDLVMLFIIRIELFCFIKLW